LACMNRGLLCLFGETKMHRIDVENKLQIKQLLYAGAVLGIKGNQFRAFEGFQLWWYDRKHNICHCAESHWLDTRQRSTPHSFKKTVKILWHNRDSLFMSIKHVSEDKRLRLFRVLGKAHSAGEKGHR